MPTYSIIISTLPGSLVWLSQCINSVVDRTAGNFEIVLLYHKGDTVTKSFSQDYDQIVMVEIDPDVEPTHFSYAYNKGLEAARGIYLIVMNDDIVVSQDWNILMMRAQDSVENESGMTVGLVGPVSNNVAGLQRLQLGSESGIPSPESTELISELTRDRNKDERLTSLFLSGFCQFFRRNFYDEMRENGNEFYSLQLENGAEDNLISLRSVLAGNLNIIVGDCYVFHHGSMTMNRVDAGNGRGLKQLSKYYEVAKKYLPEKEKLASACRVRLLTEGHKTIFMQALEQHLSLADVVILVNDRSKIWPKDEIDALSEKYGTPIVEHKYERGHDEVRDRQKLLAMAREEEATWFLSFDADEIFEDKFDREYVQKLIHPPRPDIMSFIFHWYTFWDDACTMWRVDSTFGAMHGSRLTRILPNYDMRATKSGLHTGNIPCHQLTDATRVTSVRIKHYGYNTEEERSRKYEFYEHIDKIKDIIEVGQEGYDHLVPDVYQVARFDEDSRISIGTIVLNEEISLHNFLSENWAFADELVFCDTGSDDGTVELLKKWGARVIDYEEETGEKWDRDLVDLSKARNIVMNNIRYKWYWHQDIDEVLLRDHRKPHPLALIRRMIDRPKVDGYQFMFRNFHPSGRWVHSQSTRLMKDPARFRYSGYVHETVDMCTDGMDIQLMPVEVMHQGWLCSDERAKEKLKIYLRGNLRMVQDYPEDPRGWFNSGLHMFDIGYDNSGMMYLQNAIRLKKDFPAAVKELIAQGGRALKEQVDALYDMTPPGHPFSEYAQQFSLALDQFAADNESMIRSPEHVEEVLSEPMFRNIANQIIQMEGGVREEDG